MKRLAHCVLPTRHGKGGRGTGHHCHSRRDTKRYDGLLQLMASQAKTPTAQRTLSLAHTFGKRQELQQVQRSDSAGGLTRNKDSRYGYDPMSRRLWKEQYRDQDGNPLAAPKRTTYLYADEGLIAEATQAITLNADGSVTASAPPVVTTQYGPRPDAPFTTGLLFIKTQNSKGLATLAYYHHDHLGTPIQATDKTGRVVWAADYNAFGLASIITPAATEEAPTISSNLRLAGQYWDEETGLHYNWHRYYEPGTGRYIQSDPIGLGGGINTFAYVDHDPVNAIDPTGEAFFVPLLYGAVGMYSRCVAQCTATAAVGSMLGQPCEDLGTSAKGCAVTCLNPMNWGSSKGPRSNIAGKVGTTYRVPPGPPGTTTNTGKPYIGRHTGPDPAANRASTDGRDRKQAEVTGTYNGWDPRGGGATAEQAKIDEAGGIGNLDNKINAKRKK